MQTQSIRCLASIVYTFNTMYHLDITYEDSPIVYAGDKKDVTARQYQATSTEQHVFVPRGGALAFQYSLDPSSHAPSNVNEALTELLNVYRAAKYPGDYTVLKDPNGFRIEPISFQSAEGNRAVTTSIMDATLSVAKTSSPTLEKVMTMALAAASAKAGYEIVMGAAAPHEFADTILDESLSNVTARTAIHYALRKVGLKMSWLLLYDPTFNYYVFTLYAV